MGRRWYNEDYRKLYTRQDGPWLALPAAARALASDLLKYADEHGVVALIGKGETPGDAVAGVVRAKASERQWVADAVDALLEDTYMIKRGAKLLIRNFTVAQERLSQDAIRKRRQRDKEAVAAGQDPGQGRDMTGTEPGQERDKERDMTGTSERDSHGDVTPDVTPLSAVSRRDETRRDETKSAPDTRAQATGGERQRLTAHVMGLIGTNRRAGVMPPGDLVAAIADHAEAIAHASDGDPLALSARLVEVFDAYRASCSPGKAPDWRVDRWRDHRGRLERLLAGSDPWPKPWQAPIASLPGTALLPDPSDRPERQPIRAKLPTGPALPCPFPSPFADDPKPDGAA